MTDTPTPPAMTPEQRAEFVAWLRRVRMRPAVADQLEADGVTIATLTAERDELKAAIDGIEISNGLTTNGNLWRLWARMAKDSAEKTKEAQAEIARLTAALATAREDGMRGAAALIKPTYARPCECSGCYCGNIDSAQEVASWDSDNAAAKTIEAAIQKGAAT